MGPPRPTLQEIATERSPPLVLRIASGEMAMQKHWTAMSKTSEELIFLFALGTNPIGIFALMGCPVCAIPGFLWPPSLGILILGEEVKSQRGKACLQEFSSIGESGIQQLAGTFGSLSVASIVENELRIKLASKGFEDRIQPITLAEGDWSVDDFKETARQTNSPTLLIGYIFIEGRWGMFDGKCALKINVYVPLRAITVDPPNSDVAYQYIAVEREASEPGVIKKWAENPEAARDWMRSVLKEFAARIADVYSAP